MANPNPVNDLVTVTEDEVVDIDVLANDTGATDLTVASTTQPSNGTVTVNEDGTIEFDTNGEFDDLAVGESRIESFNYTVSDTNGATETATVTITVEGVNDAATIGDPTFNIDEDGSVQVSILTNGQINLDDIDGDENAAFVAAVGTPQNGVAEIDGDNPRVLRYTPNADFVGTDTFTYTIEDEGGAQTTGTVTVNVAPVNDAPVAVDDTATTSEDTAIDIDVLANDTDIDSGVLEVISLGTPTSGTVTENPDGTIKFTPAADVFGQSTFTYVVSDGNGGSDTATVTVNVSSVNDLPIAGDDSETLAEDTPVNIDVLANDSDLEDTELDVSIATGPQFGSVEVENDGTITYTPNSQYVGDDSFTYTVTDDDGGTDTATVTLTVTAEPDAPIANDDTASTNEEEGVTIAVLTNDAEVDGQDISIVSFTQGSDGTVEQNNGTLSYTPDDDFFGTDTFTYTISDGDSNTPDATATVTVTVNPLNDAPTAVDNNITIDEDTPTSINVILNDTDVDNPNGDLTVTGATNGANGTTALASDGKSVIYTPDADFVGVDTFTYTMSDGAGGSDSALVVVTVENVNDAPRPQTTAVTTVQNGTLEGTLEADDPDVNATITFDLAANGAPSNGTVNIESDGDFTYTPDASFVGTDTFTYEVTDGALTTTQEVTVTVAFADVAYSIAPLTVDTAEGDTGGPTVFSFTVSRVGDTSNAATIDVEFDANASPLVEAIDFASGAFPTTQTLSFAADETSKTVTVEVAPDLITGEGDESFTLTLANASEGIISPTGGSAVGTILDDDPIPTPNEIIAIETIDNEALVGRAGADVETVTVDGSTYTYIAARQFNASVPGDTGVQSYEFSEGQLSFLALTSLANLGSSGANALTSATVDGTTFLIAGVFPTAGATTAGLEVFEVDADGGLTSTDTVSSTAEFDSLDTTRALIAGEIDGTTFVVAAADDQIISFELDADGELTDVDILQDNGVSTLLGRPQDLTAVNVDDAIYLIAPSDTDDALTVIEIDSSGQLSVADTVIASNDTEFAGAQSVASAEIGDAAFVFAAGFNDFGISTLAIDENGALTSTARVVPTDANDTPIAVNGFTSLQAFEFQGAHFLAALNDAGGLFVFEIAANGELSYIALGADDGANALGDPSGLEILVDGVNAAAIVSDETSAASNDDVIASVLDLGAALREHLNIVLNFAPEAQNFAVESAEDAVISGSVIATDQDVDDELTFTLGAEPANGDVVVEEDGDFTYTPDTDFVGVDEFTVTVTDLDGATDTATVSITVTPVNDEPTPTDDSGTGFTTTEDAAFVTGNVLTNDTDPDGDTLFVIGLDASETLATVNGNGDGTFTYSPNGVFQSLGAGESATDTFQYVVFDGEGETNTARVTVTIQGVNDAPSANADSGLGFTTTEDSTFVTGDVLANDSDVDSTTLSVSGLDTTGTLGAVTDNGDGTFTYNPNGQFEGLASGESATDTFTYTVSDGEGGATTAVVTVTITGADETVVLIGQREDDTLIGNALDNEIFGRFGDDQLDGAAGDDTVIGGNGDDVVRGGAGDDTLNGGAGDDQVFGDAGNDTVRGNSGMDIVSGGDGDDMVLAGGGDDTATGGAGNDTVIGQGGNDTMSGGDGDDTLFGRNGDDDIDGDAGDDMLFGGAGIDDLSGGDGDDTLRGNDGADTLSGDAGADILIGGVGDDTIIGGTGNDTLTGGFGSDDFVFDASSGFDVIRDFEVGSDTIDLTALGVTFADVSISTVNDGQRIVVDDVNIQLRELSAGSLTEDDFLF